LPRRIGLRSDGFELRVAREAAPVATVRWAEIQSIRAYKLDRWVHDVICLAFQIGPDHWVEISEQDESLSQVCNEMAARFPEIPPGWLCDIAVPAFEFNDTVLYPFDAKAYAAQLKARADRRSPPDSLSMWDHVLLSCGTASALILIAAGRSLATIVPLLTALATVVLGIGLRRKYDVHTVSQQLVDSAWRKWSLRRGDARYLTGSLARISTVLCPRVFASRPDTRNRMPIGMYRSTRPRRSLGSQERADTENSGRGQDSGGGEIGCAGRPKCIPGETSQGGQVVEKAAFRTALDGLAAKVAATLWAVVLPGIPGHGPDIVFA